MEDTSKFILKPINCFVNSKRYGARQYFEQVLISDYDNYPIAVMHVDYFGSMYSKGVYERLKAGETLTVKFTLEIVEDGE